MIYFQHVTSVEGKIDKKVTNPGQLTMVVKTVCIHQTATMKSMYKEVT